jgi:hypothetical protein
MLRFSKAAKGALWASQVAPGNENNLRLRVYGEKAGLELRPADVNELWFTPLGEPRRIIRLGGGGAGPFAGHASRIPAGHPEGYLESFAQLYADLSEQIIAKQEGTAETPIASRTGDLGWCRRSQIHNCGARVPRIKILLGLAHRDPLGTSPLGPVSSVKAFALIAANNECQNRAQRSLPPTSSRLVRELVRV